MAIQGDFELNSQGYVIVPDKDRVKRFRRRTEQPFLDAETTSGQKDQESIKLYDSRIYRSPILGLGVDRIPSDQSKNPDFYRRLWDGEADIWPSGIFLPLLEASSTKVSGGNQDGPAKIRAGVDFKGEWVTLGEDDDTINDVHLYTYTGSSTAYTFSDTVKSDVTDESIGLDMINIGDRLVILYAFQDDHEVCFISTLGGGVTQATTDPTVGLLGSSVGRNEDRDGGLLEFIGDEVVAILWHEGLLQITFFSSSNSAVDFNVDEGLNIASAGGPKGIAKFIGEDGIEKLLVGTEEGIWEVDVVPGTWTSRLIHAMPAHEDNCRRMAIGPDGALWFSQGVSDTEVFQVFRLSVVDSKYRVEPVPNSPHLEDGVPAGMLGTVRRLVSSGGFMYAAIGGGSSTTKARILKHNGFGWVPVRKNSTANQKIHFIGASSNDDSIPRLHYSVRTSSTNENHKFLREPNAHPLSGATINRKATGDVHFGTMDGGMPNIPTIYLRAQTVTNSLSADKTGEFTTLDYAGDGESRGANNLGNFFSGLKSLLWNFGRGIASKELTPKLSLARDSGDTTDSPQVHSLEINYVKDPDIVQSWRCTIDLEATATLQETSVETVIARIQAAQALGTLPTFSYGPVSQGAFDYNVELDGATGNITVSDETSVQNQWDGGAGFSIRINLDSDGEGSSARLFGKGNIWYCFVSAESSGAVKLTFIYTWSGTDGNWVTTNTVINIGEWYTIGVEYDADSTGNNPTFFIYRESTKTLVALTEGSGIEASTPSGTRTTDVGSDFVMGNRGADDLTVDGQLDEAVWYGTTGNLASQDNDAEKVGNETNLIHYWPFNEGSGTHIGDKDYSNSADGVASSITWDRTGLGRRYVKVHIPEWEEEVEERASEGGVAAINALAIRKGTVDIILEERVV